MVDVPRLLHHYLLLDGKIFDYEDYSQMLLNSKIKKEIKIYNFYFLGFKLVKDFFKNYV